MPGLTTIPPFPQDIPTHPLLVIDYQLVKAGNEDEVNKLWKAATELGFWYLKNHGVEEEVEGMFEMGRETFALPLEEKLPFDQGDEGNQFGYKAAGVQYMDDHGTKDATEFVNVAKDDAFAWPKVVRRTYPSTVIARMESTIKPFVEKSQAVNHTLINALNDKIGLPKGALASLHKGEELSSCTARVIRAPPHVESNGKTFLTAHTDTGSISFLHNRLGGLQVLPPGADQWYYVKPLPGHAICNVGDALNILSGGILRSNIHRVVPPPKEQAQYDRYSVVFFSRPNDKVELRALADLNETIAEAVARAPPGKYEPGITSEEWQIRRYKARRIANYKGAESWKVWKGTMEAKDPDAETV